MGSRCLKKDENALSPICFQWKSEVFLSGTGSVEYSKKSRRTRASREFPAEVIVLYARRKGRIFSWSIVVVTPCLRYFFRTATNSMYPVVTGYSSSLSNSSAIHKAMLLRSVSCAFLIYAVFISTLNSHRLWKVYHLGKSLARRVDRWIIQMYNLPYI